MSDVAFEQALKDLETAVERLESGELSLEESLACFEDGVRNAQLCRKALKGVEARVELLLKNDDGALSSAPFADEN